MVLSMRCVYALAATSLVVPVQAATGFYSIVCSGSLCQEPSRGRSPSATAFASFADEIELTGWARLDVGSDLKDNDPGTVAFAAGYLEGYLTANRTLQMLQNYKAYYKLDPLPDSIKSFLQANDAWVENKLQHPESQDPYWHVVNFIYHQLDGIVAGVNARLGEASLSRQDALLLNLQGDIEELKLALNVTARPDFDGMEPEEIESWDVAHSHCSALVKLLPDGSDILVGHNMWWPYYAMLRVFKHYSFPYILGGQLSSLSFSSYPGILASTDDFYQTGSQLVVMETTNSVSNMALYDLVKPQALFYWVRAMLANYLARSGPGWMKLFEQYNSGTYNNMWMVVDYNLFKPHEPTLPCGILTVGEQLPDYFHFEDQTFALSYGYWPSYNRALYPETSKLSGQDAMVAKHGKYWSYHFTARANIFRRDEGAVHGEADMKRILRYNQYQTDALAEGHPCWQLACRADLQDSNHSDVPNAVGAIDAKFTSFARMKRSETLVVSGPTHDDQPVFDWSSVPSQVSGMSHIGQPDRFDFDWVIMAPSGVSNAMLEKVVV